MTTETPSNETGTDAGGVVGCGGGLCVPGAVAILCNTLGPMDDQAEIERLLAPTKVLWLQGMEGVVDFRQVILPIS